MAYCKSCGAYLPDGTSVCLACGYQEAPEPAPSAAQKQAEQKKEQQDDAREVMDRHRKLQQEKSKQWAEQEKARRDQQEQNRRWAREEYAKRQAQREVEAEVKARDEARRREEAQQSSRRQARPNAPQASTGGNTALAALSYFSVFFALPFIFAPQDEFAVFHAKQGMRLFVFSAIADVIAKIIPFGWVLSLFRIYCIIKGITSALNGKKEPLPYIGTIGQSQ